MFFIAFRMIRTTIIFMSMAFPFHLAYACEKTANNKDARIFSIGEQIRISVLDENELTNEYIIDDAGMILMPLIGKTQIAGMSSAQIEKQITDTLKDGYIINPIISVSATQPNGFYIMGEIQKPGRYNLTNEVNLLSAVALAGGFTKHAHKKKFKILRKACNNTKQVQNNPAGNQIFAGDIIIVKKRLF